MKIFLFHMAMFLLGFSISAMLSGRGIDGAKGVFAVSLAILYACFMSWLFGEKEVDGEDNSDKV